MVFNNRELDDLVILRSNSTPIYNFCVVLRGPEPSVFFVRLGDSSLDFEVRVFVRELNDCMPLTHEFHMCIERALKEHNISVPFPQRDVHVWFMGANEAQAVKLQTEPQKPPRVTGVSHHK